VPHWQRVLTLALLILPAALILCCGLGGWTTYALVVRRLKLHHNPIWIRLGRPPYIPSWPPAGYYYGALFDWIWGGDYVEVSDVVTARLARTCRYLFFGVFAGLGLVALVTVYGLILMLSTSNQRLERP
jgi:hypothetical protein